MAQYEHLPIYKAAFGLTVYLETVVKGFSRYHKYTLGEALRKTSLQVVMLIVRANNTPDRITVLKEVRIRLEQLKVLFRMGKELKAFHNFNSFETGINQVITIARQNEGWIKTLAGQRKRPESPGHARYGKGR